MDCEKFEPLLLDELYDELDEVTSAAVKRHVSGCARCAPILDGMRSTRSLAVLPMLEVPSALEDRILASVKEAQKESPLFGRNSRTVDVERSSQSRASRALSWAGSWAMRPQTAMAAVFLLMIGTSAFVIRSRHSSERAARVSVTEQGIPAGQIAPADDHESLDSKAAAAAHGPNVPVPTSAPPFPSPVASAGGALALGGDPLSGVIGGNAGPMDGLTGGKGRATSGEAFGSALAANLDDSKDRDKAEAQGTAEKKTTLRSGSRPSDVSNAAAPAGAPNDNRAQAPAAPQSQAAQAQQDGFSAGMAAYRARSFVEATRHFDSAARLGDQNAALWAAKSVKDGNGGCGAAVPRFESVAQKSSGSWIGHEAQLEAARCQIAAGQLDAAREKLTKLSGVPSHAAPAQQALNELNQIASRREAERAKSAGGSGRPATAAPARAPAAKPASTTNGDNAF